jgi:plastocyanin
MAAHYVIKITGDPASFDPPNLHADPGDVVSWSNTTRKPHQLWQLDQNGASVPVPLGGDRWDPIRPGKQSSLWTVPSGPSVITYGCILHQGETGSITLN